MPALYDSCTEKVRASRWLTLELILSNRRMEYLGEHKVLHRTEVPGDP